MSKETATALVNQFATSRPGGAAWPNIDRMDMAYGLLVRIDDPNKINQAGTPFCGPASLTRSVAQSNPDAYVRAAIDLYTRGTATMGSLNITPGSEVKKSAPQGGTNPADWIMLASIRDCDNWFLSTAGLFGLNLAGVTRPGTLESWFRSAGYTDIVNATYLAAKPIPSVLAMEAQLASSLFSQGYKVAMLIDSDMLDSDCQDDLISMYPDHWVALASTITDGGIVNYNASVSFTVFTWGRQQSVPVAAQKPLKKKDFLHKYYGFVAGRM